MENLEILQSLSELQIAKLTWVYWFCKQRNVNDDELMLLFHITKEECGEKAATRLFQIIKDSNHQ